MSTSEEQEMFRRLAEDIRSYTQTPKVDAESFSIYETVFERGIAELARHPLGRGIQEDLRVWLMISGYDHGFCHAIRPSMIPDLIWAGLVVSLRVTVYGVCGLLALLGFPLVLGYILCCNRNEAEVILDTWLSTVIFVFYPPVFGLCLLGAAVPMPLNLAFLPGIPHVIKAAANATPSTTNNQNNKGLPLVQRSFLIDAIAVFMVHGSCACLLGVLSVIAHPLFLLLTVLWCLSLYPRLLIVRRPRLVEWAARGFMERVKATTVSLLVAPDLVLAFLVMNMAMDRFARVLTFVHNRSVAVHAPDNSTTSSKYSTVPPRRKGTDLLTMYFRGHLPLAGCALSVIGTFRAKSAHVFLERGIPSHMVCVAANKTWRVECARGRMSTPVSYKWTNGGDRFLEDILIFCEHCGQQMQGKKGGLDPSSLPPGQYWIDHLCTSAKDLFDEMPRAAALYMIRSRYKHGGWHLDSGWLRWECMADILPWLVPWIGDGVVVDLLSMVAIAGMRPMYDRTDLLHVSNPLGGRWALQATHMLNEFSRHGRDHVLELCQEPGKCCVERKDPLFGDTGVLRDEVEWATEMTTVQLTGSYREGRDQYLVSRVQGQFLALLCKVSAVSEGTSFHLVRVKHVPKKRVSFWKKPQTHVVGFDA